MSSDRHTLAAPTGVGAMVLGDLRLAKGTWFEWHRHPQHQIAWTPESVLAVEAGGAQWVLPTTRALFLPAGALHRTGSIQGSLLRGIYIEPDRCPVEWTSPTMLRSAPAPARWRGLSSARRR